LTIADRLEVAVLVTVATGWLPCSWRGLPAETARQSEGGIELCCIQSVLVFAH